MITEDYVSFETAKLLKEKGFEVPSFKPEEWLFCMYDEQGKLHWGVYSDNWYCRVTLQMAMKWLREEHGFHCSVDYDFVLGWYCQITSLKETVEYDYKEMKYYHPVKNDGFSTPEEACEAAIKYCLENLI